ncbi:MAG: sulfotransferase [Deltaproteobacteria bacterium]|nr:sulfotransferase [Deltaproteobacteria bacterium]
MSGVPFFVLGCPRSGTSWLGAVLDAHPRLRCGMELDLLSAFQQVARARAVHGSPERARGGPTVLRGGANQLAAMHLHDIVRWELAESGKPRFGDKTPSYALNMEVLTATFAGCQFIHILRDGRDNVSSLLQSEASQRHWRTEDWVPRSVEAAARYWLEHVRRAQASGAALGPGRYVEVRYEALMESPLAEGRRLLRFLGEDDAPAVDAQLQTAQRKSPRWHERLSPAELRRFHLVPGVDALCAALGYPLYTTPDPGPAAAAAAVTHAEAAAAAGDDRAAVEIIEQGAAQGADSAGMWATLARAEQRRGRPAVAAQLRVRVLRNFPFDPAVCAELLAQADLPEAVFGLTAALAGGVGRLRPAIESFLVARGLDPAGARALAHGLPEPKRPQPGDHALAPLHRLRVALRTDDHAAMQRLLPEAVALCRDPRTAHEAQVLLTEVGRVRGDPGWLRHALQLAGAGRLDALLQLAGAQTSSAGADALTATLQRIELPAAREGVAAALRARGLDDDVSNALTVRLANQRAAWLQP